MDEWIRKCNINIGMYNGRLLNQRKEENPAIETTWMHLEGIMLREVNQTGTGKCCMVLYSTYHILNLKKKEV